MWTYSFFCQRNNKSLEKQFWMLRIVLSAKACVRKVFMLLLAWIFVYAVSVKNAFMLLLLLLIVAQFKHNLNIFQKGCKLFDLRFNTTREKRKTKHIEQNGSEWQSLHICCIIPRLILFSFAICSTSIESSNFRL